MVLLHVYSLQVRFFYVQCLKTISYAITQFQMLLFVLQKVKVIELNCI